ncbi:hypothetical protein AB6A40_006908 [Gnathostoma spinigerum]|uniref:Uncharacterized protein n=1 Tax=Gnathostoma spinigerum TaxID=75299 RepID=A0ABD6EPV8_9BILA
MTTIYLLFASFPIPIVYISPLPLAIVTVVAILLTYVIAFFASLMVEVPAANLERILLNRGSQRLRNGVASSPFPTTKYTQSDVLNHEMTMTKKNTGDDFQLISMNTKMFDGDQSA